MAMFLSNKISIFECVIYSFDPHREENAYKRAKKCLHKQPAPNMYNCEFPGENVEGYFLSLHLYYSGRGHLQLVNAAALFTRLGFKKLLSSCTCISRYCTLCFAAWSNGVPRNRTLAVPSPAFSTST